MKEIKDYYGKTVIFGTIKECSMYIFEKYQETFYTEFKGFSFSVDIPDILKQKLNTASDKITTFEACKHIYEYIDAYEGDWYECFDVSYEFKAFNHHKIVAGRINKNGFACIELNCKSKYTRLMDCIIEATRFKKDEDCDCICIVEPDFIEKD